MSRVGFSIYKGTEVAHWPRITIRRGQVVYQVLSRSSPMAPQVMQAEIHAVVGLVYAPGRSLAFSHCYQEEV